MFSTMAAIAVSVVFYAVETTAEALAGQVHVVSGTVTPVTGAVDSGMLWRAY